VDQEDPQKEAVYSWEDAWEPWCRNSLTLTQCRDWIESACRLYDVPAPRVRQHRSREFSWCHIGLGVISIQGGKRDAQGGRNCATALHEAAHWIVFTLFGEQPQDHGPTFLGVYMWLLENSRIAPRSALHGSARHYGLKWREMGPEQCRS